LLRAGADVHVDARARTLSETGSPRSAREDDAITAALDESFYPLAQAETEDLSLIILWETSGANIVVAMIKTYLINIIDR
jgi:hypothetical protein